jgi:hypothetical protein
MKYKAFISYRHSENGRRHAVALETALKRYAKPTLSRPMKIFRDEKHMKPDISLPKLIRDGLEDSEFLIFLAEKASAESQWCGEELEHWCNPAKLNRTDRLIIALIDDDIVLDGTNSIDWEQTTALPRLLQPYLPSIPLYMDLRWAETDEERRLENKDYHACITPLVARLKHVTPEELTDQELKTYRRNIRLRNWAIGILSAFLLIAVSAGMVAWRQTLIAQEERKNAQAEQKKAEGALAEMKRAQAQRLRYQADAFVGYEEFQFARNFYEDALQLTPDDAYLKERIEFCDENLKKTNPSR